ncbi:MAG: ABC transporter ATP-binding protein [Raoultibacter sp.]
METENDVTAPGNPSAASSVTPGVQPILSVDNFTKRYGGKCAVNDVSLAVMPGDIYGFIGHNGAGKTTLIRAVAGVMDFDGGVITIEGRSVKSDAVACKSVTAYVPDNPDIYDFLTGIQYLTYMGDIFSVNVAVRQQRIQKYGELLLMSDCLGDLISSYSHGMKQKLVLIGAFLHQPKLLVLDEPFVGLDPQSSFHLKNMMKELVAGGSAIFFSSHVLEVVEKLCNKLAIINAGRLVQSGLTVDIAGSEGLEGVFLDLLDNPAAVVPTADSVGAASGGVAGTEQAGR